MRKNFTAPPGPGSCLLNCRVGKHPLPTLRTRNAIVDPRAGASSPLGRFSGAGDPPTSKTGRRFRGSGRVVAKRAG